MARLTCSLLLTAFVVGVSGARAQDQPVEPATSYLTAIKQELARLDLEARCDPLAETCVFQRALVKGDAPHEVVVRYSRRTSTVYVYIDRLVEIDDPEGPGLPLARRLLDLNRSLVTGKLEWDRLTRSIRLSVVVNTDSNFDRKAFRSQIIGLWTSAARILPELRRLATGAPEPSPPEGSVDARR